MQATHTITRIKQREVMINFFRKIRHGLMEKNKTGKYLKYALGEILLVVVGILIALQLNNWNEARKKTNEINSIIVDFEMELETNIHTSNRMLRIGYGLDSLTSKIKQKQITEELIQSRFAFPFFNTFLQKFLADNLDELIASERQMSEKYKIIISDLKELKRRIESQHKWENRATDISAERSKEMIDTLPWLFSEDPLKTQKALEHTINDPFFRNKVLSYLGFQLNENVWDASLIRTSSLAILYKIRILKNENIELTPFLESFGLTAFNTLNCDDKSSPIIDEVNFRTNFVVYNKLDTAVSYRIVDENGQMKDQPTRVLEPQSFNLDYFSLPNNLRIQLLKDGKCETVYTYAKDGFVIFE